MAQIKRKSFELGKLPKGGKSGKFKGKVPMSEKFMAKVVTGKKTFQLGKVHTTKASASSLGKILGKQKVEVKLVAGKDGKTKIVIPKRVTFNIKKATKR